MPGAHIADPAPLGLAAFGFTTFLLMTVDAGWLPETLTPVAFGMALAYGGAAQFAAGLWEFAKGNTFGATAFCSYGAFWVSYWWLTGHNAAELPAADAHKAIGMYLLTWAIFTAYMSVAASKVNMAVLAVFVLLTITFLLLAWGEFDDVDRHHQARRLPRAADRARGLVRVVRRRDGLHVGSPGVPGRRSARVAGPAASNRPRTGRPPTLRS